MKILINENQFDKLIDNYITSRIGKVTFELYTSGSVKYADIYGIGKNGKIIFFIKNENKTIYVVESIFQEIKNVFNLKDRHTPIKVFSRWMKNHIPKEYQRKRISTWGFGNTAEEPRLINGKVTY